jgi:hypothetical protein
MRQWQQAGLAGLAILGALPALALAHTLTLNRATQPPEAGFMHDGHFEAAPAQRITARATVTHPASRAPARAAAYWASYEGPPAGRGPQGERRPGPKGPGNDATDITRNLAWTVAVVHPRAPLDQLPKGRLSLLPVGQPMVARAGGTVRVRVLLDGAPLPGATIRLEALQRDVGGATVTTDASGEASAPIPSAGPHLFVVVHTENPSSDPTVDILRLQASLGFDAVRSR